MSEEEREELINQVHILEQGHKWKAIANLLKELNEMDAADIIKEISPEVTTLVFRSLPKDFAADLFANLEPKEQGVILRGATDKEVGDLLEELMVDDAVDALEELPANVVAKLLTYVSPETRATINKFLQYKENTVGSIMTAEFIALKKSMTVLAAMEMIKRAASESEQIYICYVMDESRHLEGVVSLRDLILAKDDMLIGDIMTDNPISTTTSEDQEAVTELFSKYDLLAIPVVDAENRLVGIVTVDDIFDVIEEEVTEDMEKMAAVTPSDKPYLEAGVFHLAKNRIIWLVLLMFSSIFSSFVLTKNNEVFSAIPLLIAFIPMLTDAAGNAGSQSSATIIRSIATHEISGKDFLRVFWKEARIGMVAGVVLATFNFVRMIIQYGNVEVALAVSIALIFTVIIAKLLGCIFPFLARIVKVDPALMASPLITTIMDTLSLVVYIGVCRIVLHI